jgi:hypothetical protein
MRMALHFVSKDASASRNDVQRRQARSRVKLVAAL